MTESTAQLCVWMSISGRTGAGCQAKFDEFDTIFSVISNSVCYQEYKKKKKTIFPRTFDALNI